ATPIEAASTPVQAPKIVVDPKFKKLPFDEFEKGYVAAKRALHNERATNLSGKFLSYSQLHAPTLTMFVAHIEFLEQVLQLICACLSFDEPAGAVEKVKELLDIVHHLFDPLSDDKRICSEDFYNQKHN